VRILIIGAGQVGYSIAESLSEAHQIVVMDINPDRVSELTYSLDVLAICGDGNDLNNLEEVGLVDMIIACTNDDEKNLIACESSKLIGETFTVARVKNSTLFESWSRSIGAFGVDFMACSDRLTAETIVNIAGIPAALDADSFAGGKVQMAEFEVTEDSALVNQTVSEADQFASLTFAAIIMEDQIVIPSGSTKIPIGSRLVVIGTPESVQKFSSVIKPTTNKTENIAILGGSNISAEIASIFSTRGMKPTLMTADRDLSIKLAEKLPNTVVMCHDVTDIEFLKSENIIQADLVVIHLDSDEETLLVSLLVKQLGASRVASIINSGDYVSLFENVGIDVAVNPREVTAEALIHFTHNVNTKRVAILDSNRVEILEIEIDSNSKLSGRNVKAITADMPASVVIGAIVRDGQVLAPRGDTMIQYQDNIVILVDVSVLDNILKQL
tara:strand:+ start:6981 stop:8306 length:1326 start_codon:yes stop_codon:yes gene_type:complete